VKAKTESHEQWSHRGMRIKNASSLCGAVHDPHMKCPCGTNRVYRISLHNF
jgi:hypothetical protein